MTSITGAKVSAGRSAAVLVAAGPGHVLVRRGPGSPLHVVRPSRGLLPNGMLSFFDRPLCGVSAALRPVGVDGRAFWLAPVCGRCRRAAQRLLDGLLAALPPSPGDVELLRRLVDGWTDPGTVDRLRMPLIRSSVSSGHLAVLRRRFAARRGEMGLLVPPLPSQRRPRRNAYGRWVA